VQARLEELKQEKDRLELAATHWRFTRVSQLHNQVASWEPRLRDEPWLAGFPADVQRSVDTLAADRRNLRQQLEAAGAQARDAEALKLRAPYVESVHVDAEQEMIRSAERLRGVRADLTEQKSKQERALSRLEDIATYLDKHQEMARTADRLPDLLEQQAALNAAQEDLAKANADVREYGVGRDAAERTRLEELDGIIKPYRACVPEVADHLARREQLAKERRELEQRRANLEPQLKSAGQPYYYGAIVAGFLILISMWLGVSVFKAPWLAVLIPIFLLALLGWLIFSGYRHSQASVAARRALSKDVEPALAELTAADTALEERAAQVREQFALALNTWNHLAEVLPEYQRLSLSLEAYKQALGARDSAEARRKAAWERVRTICLDAPGKIDAGWLTNRLRVLREIVSLRTRKNDEHAKLRDAEFQLEQLRMAESDLVRKLKAELEPLGLAAQLEKDEGLAIEHFQAMVNETRHYKQLLRESKSQAQLDEEDHKLLAQLEKILAPIGLAELAQSDPEAALLEFELRR